MFCADISYRTVASLAVQFSVDVVFLDYYILNTSADLEEDSLLGINGFVWGGMFMYKSRSVCLSAFACMQPESVVFAGG